MAEEETQGLEYMDPPESPLETASETKDLICEDKVEIPQPDYSNDADTGPKSEDDTVCGEPKEHGQGSLADDGEISKQDEENTSVQEGDKEIATRHEEVTTTHMETEISEKHAFESVTETVSDNQDFTSIVSKSVTEKTSSISESMTFEVVELSSKGESLNGSDTDSIAMIRGSPYYDSLIANRISSEIFAQGMQSKLEAHDILTEEQTLQKVISESLDSTGPHVDYSTQTSEPVQQNGLLQEESFRRLESEITQNGGRLVSTEEVSVTNSANQMFKVSNIRNKLFSDVTESTSLNCAASSDLKETQQTMVSSQLEVEQIPSEGDMGVPPTNECGDVPYSLSPNAYKPAADEMDFVEFPRKKKMFSSSSFYEEPNAIYPTVEEQVELCRKIADSLCDDTNKKSKGANMFFKRVKKAEKWIHESTGTEQDGNFSYSETSYTESTTDPSNVPYVRVSKGPTQLKLILDPRHLLDMKRLRQEGINIVEHNAVSPEICLDLVKDLNSPKGKGGQLFAKRKKKSEEWVVDEEKVKALLKSREHGYVPSPEPSNDPSRASNIESLVQSRVQMIKTPWAAAMESPIGSCQGAFRDVNPNEVAESVIRAAETKVMTYPTPVRPVIEPGFKSESRVSQLQQIQSPVGFTPPQQLSAKPLISSPFKTGVYTADPYRPRTPKGWNGISSGSFKFSPLPTIYQAGEQVQPQFAEKSSPEQNHIVSGAETVSKLTEMTTFSKSYNFTNFNASPKAWGSANTMAYQNQHIKSVKPPSVLVQ